MLACASSPPPLSWHLPVIQSLGTAFVAAEARQLTSVQLETAAATVPLKLTRSRQHGGSADDIGQTRIHE
jgi:hypothetical protein